MILILSCHKSGDGFPVVILRVWKPNLEEGQQHKVDISVDHFIPLA